MAIASSSRSPRGIPCSLRNLNQVFPRNAPVLRSGDAVSLQPARVEPLTDGARGHLTNFGDLTSCEDLHRRLSDITFHIGLGCALGGIRPAAERLRPLTRGSAPLFAPSFGCLRQPTLPQASGSGPNVIHSALGCGSAPSDPRRTNYIGNQGIRKPEKIRKIEKACFNQPISINSDSFRTIQAEYDRQGRDEQTAARGEHEINRQGVAFKAGSPLCSLHSRAWLARSPSWKRAFCLITSNPYGGATLERFSDRNEQSDECGRNGNDSRNDSRKTGTPAAFRGRRHVGPRNSSQSWRPTARRLERRADTKALPLAAKPLHSTARSRYSISPNLATARSFSTNSARSLDSGISKCMKSLVGRVDEA